MAKKEINFALLAIIAAGSLSSVGYANVSAASAKPLEKDGLVQVNPSADFKDEEGNPAVRITEKGTAALAEHEASKPKEADVGGDAPNTPAPAAKVKPSFALVSGIAIPQTVRAPRNSPGSSYPFDALEIGMSFFVPETEDRKNIAKSMASTVTTANARFSTEVPGQTRVNRKGNIVPMTTQDRKFIVRNVEDGAPWGEQYAGMKGGAVFRIAVGGADDTDTEAE